MSVRGGGRKDVGTWVSESSMSLVGVAWVGGDKWRSPSVTITTEVASCSSRSFVASGVVQDVLRLLAFRLLR